MTMHSRLFMQLSKVHSKWPDAAAPQSTPQISGIQVTCGWRCGATQARGSPGWPPATSRAARAPGGHCLPVHAVPWRHQRRPPLAVAAAGVGHPWRWGPTGFMS